MNDQYHAGAHDALEAFRAAISDMAREDIDGEHGAVTYRDLLGGIDSAIAVTRERAIADAFTPPDPFSRKA